MRVLILHNRYHQQGGEDLVALAEAQLLRSHGIEVRQFEADNHPAAGRRASGAVRLVLSAAWSRDSYEAVRKLCDEFRPQVAHVHNFWMRLSPSVHAACRESGAATVQTLHNFRLLCANALLLRSGRPCEDCLGRSPWRGVVRRCYRGSFLASAAVARMMVVNRRQGTWERHVDAFIALTRFSRSKFIAGGLPPGRILIKPNFVEDSGQPASPPSASDVVVYAGRLSEEKGVRTLVSAWARGELRRYGRLLILGDGPARTSLEDHASSLRLSSPNVVFAGKRSASEARQAVANARAVVAPSICFENFPTVLAEAFCCGRPAVVSDLGALAEIVRHGTEGLTVEAGNEAALSGALETILRDGDLADRLGANARAAYLARYSPEQNYQMLMGIYRFAIESRGAALPPGLGVFAPAEAVA